MKKIMLVIGAAMSVVVSLLPAQAAPMAVAALEHPEIVTVQYRPVRGCSPMLAVRKARADGLRNVRIVSINPRRVVVAGRDRFGPDRMIFANVRGCPLLRR